ncbi:MAG: CAP domain-containing protein [Amaricoccus sp.]
MSMEVADDLELRVAASINAARADAGLAPLKVEAHLNSAAQAHSDWMGDTGSFTHAGDDDSTPADRIADAGFPLTGSWGTAENIAARTLVGGLGNDEVDAMHQGLMNSPEHLANMLNPDLSYVGIGISVGHLDGFEGNVAILTEDFGETDGRTLVQEEQDGETVFQPYQDGEPVGEAELAVTDTPDDQDEPDPNDPNDDEDQQAREAGTGCFVATAAYGTYDHPDVVALRRFKDEVLDQSRAGRAFVRVYWYVGQRLARRVSADRTSGRIARALIAPLARRAARRGGR